MTSANDRSLHDDGADRKTAVSVTFCILSYNQEVFVESALRGAFAQDYPDLEIIFSDDGSTDGTFARAQEIVSAYRGPHRVRLRQSVSNRGILHHLLDVAEEARGRLLMVSAADDVSLRQRTARMASAWHGTPFAAAFSDYELIDSDGNVIDPHYRYDDVGFSPRHYFKGSNAKNIHGASSVYDVHALAAIGRPPPGYSVFFEDTWLGLACAAMDMPVSHVGEPLVQYRQHSGAITNFGASPNQGVEAQRQADAAWQQRCARSGDTLAAFRAWHKERQGVRPINPRIDAEITYFQRVGRWTQLSLLSRMATLSFATRKWMALAVLWRVLPYSVRRLLR